MTDNMLVTVSEWMVEGNIMEFTKAYINVDRLDLVRFLVRSPYLHFSFVASLLCLSLLVANNRMITIVERRHEGADLYA